MGKAQRSIPKELSGALGTDSSFVSMSLRHLPNALPSLHPQPMSQCPCPFPSFAHTSHWPYLHRALELGLEQSML